MCFIKKCNSFIKPEIAKKDLPCFKIVIQLTEDTFTPFIFNDSITYHKGVLHKTLPLKPDFGSDNDQWTTDESRVTWLEVDEGYHSFLYKSDCIDYFKSFYLSTVMINAKIVECIIPKGAEYFINDRNEYVSNTIIIK